MRKLFATLLVALTASANEFSYRSLQSGSPIGSTPIHDRGLRGEGQIIAILDTGLHYNSCFFAEPDGTPPPMNTGTPGGGLGWTNVNPSRRKVIAYDFLYSCDQYPGANGCDEPGVLGALDNHGHGTHAAGAALGDGGEPGRHDFGDAIAPAAKLVVQDAGLTTGDACTQYPGIGCPAVLTPIFAQAYKQGARIHSNSWGDRQGTPPPLPPPTANYSSSARDVDAFVWSHPDSLMVFNTGNFGSEIDGGRGTSTPPQSSLSSPGSAKNTLQVGGTRYYGGDDHTLATFTLYGPTRDGRIKPDVVGPAKVLSSDPDLTSDGAVCRATDTTGTSWAAPTIAGAAALVRQYYTEGFYPSGVASTANRLTPSAALLKASIISAARRAIYRIENGSRVPTKPVPSYEQGWGFPVLDDVLYFPGDARRLRVIDVPLSSGLTQGQSTTLRLDVKAGAPFKAVLVWTDPPGVPRGVSDPTPELVNDLDLRVVTPSLTYYGNGITPDRLNNVEVVSLDQPSAGTYDITISAPRLGFGPRQSYALVVTGDFSEDARRARAVRH